MSLLARTIRFVSLRGEPLTNTAQPAEDLEFSASTGINIVL
jgi:hypothetical protein